MKFPVIKIKDSTEDRIVGTNSHDTLYVDPQTGGIQYLNLQCCEGTGKYGKYEFTGEVSEFSPYPEIEFVSFEELAEIYMTHLEDAGKEEAEIQGLIKEIIFKTNQKREQVIEKNGLNSDSMVFHTNGNLL